MDEPFLIDGEPHFKAAEAAQQVGIGVSRFHELSRKGRIPYIVQPHGKVYAAKDLETLRAELESWPRRRRTKKAKAA